MVDGRVILTIYSRPTILCAGETHKTLNMIIAKLPQIYLLSITT